MNQHRDEPADEDDRPAAPPTPSPEHAAESPIDGLLPPAQPANCPYCKAGPCKGWCRD